MYCASRPKQPGFSFEVLFPDDSFPPGNKQKGTCTCNSLLDSVTMSEVLTTKQKGNSQLDSVAMSEVLINKQKGNSQLDSVTMSEILTNKQKGNSQL